MTHRLLSLLLLAALFANSNAAPLTSDQTTLQVVTYNIHHGEGTDGVMDLDRIAAVIAAANPDLVALQEVDQNCTRSGNLLIANELAKRLKMQSRFAKFMNFEGGEYGLAILSRHNIETSRRIQLPAGKYEPRCALEITVNPQGAPISFVCIHNDWIDESAREKQVEALRQSLAKTSHPVILAGDFNGESNDKSIKALTTNGWIIADKNGAKTWPSDKPRVEIDFVITRGFTNLRTQSRVINEQIASDHRPLTTSLTFEKEVSNQEPKPTCLLP